MNRTTWSVSALLFALLIPTAASAELRRVEMKTLGMDWAVCAHAVRVAMRKLPGVESVDVSLERAMTDVRLRPGNTVTLDQLRKVIKNNGFNAEEADIIVVGKVSERSGQPVLSVTGTHSVLILVADPKDTKAFQQIREHLQAKRETPLEVTGRVESGEQLMVRSITVKQQR